MNVFIFQEAHLQELLNKNIGEYYYLFNVASCIHLNKSE